MYGMTAVGREGRRMRIGLAVGVALLAVLGAAQAQDAGNPWPATRPDSALFPDLTRDFERAWIEVQKRVAPRHRTLVRKAVKKRQRVSTSSRRPTHHQRLGR